jgi:MFS transporter, DHA2 family, multidrug resistance protein
MAEQGLRKLIITLTVIAAAVIELIDTSIVNVAISHMSGTLGSTLEDTAWVVTAYAIANVIIIPMTSFFAARFGRRLYYIGSILLFTAASILCGNADNIWELVAFRFIQGIGGGALLSTSQTILFETFTVQQRGFAAAIFGLGVFVGPTIGPTVGGWIIDNYSWPWIFYINVPIGIAAAISSYVYVAEPVSEHRSGKIDWAGIFLLIIGLGSLQTVLERGESDDWFQANHIIALSVVAVLGIAGFVIRELTTDHPVVDLRVLKSRPLFVAALMTFVQGFVLFATVFLIPLFAQRLLGFTAFKTGMLFLPGAAIAFVVLPLMGKMLNKGMPPQFMITFGFASLALFGWLLGHNNLGTGSNDFVLPVILRTVGLGLLIVPLTQLAISGLKGAAVGQGIALNNMMRQLGGSFGIALMNTYIAQRIGLHRVDLVSHLAIGDPATDSRLASITQTMMAKGSSFFDATHRALGVLELGIGRQATLLSYMDAFLLITVLCTLCMPLVWLAGRAAAPDAAAAKAASEAH